MSFLLLHIIASSSLVLLIVGRFLIIAFAKRSLSTLQLPILIVACLTILSGLSLLFIEAVSLTHLCISALATVGLVIGAEVWLRTTHLRRYSEGS